MEFSEFWLAIIKSLILPAIAILVFISIYYIDLAITKKKAKKRARAKRQALIEKSKREYAKLIA